MGSIGAEATLYRVGQDPYRPPSAGEPLPAGYVDQTSRARALTGLLGLFLAVELSTTVVEWATGGRAQWVGYYYNVYMALFAVCAVVFLSFVAHASQNAAVLAGRRLAHSPAATVTWFLIPIANLWKPRESVAEMWSASAAAAGEAARRAPVNAWWLAWLLAVFTGGVPALGSLAMSPIIRTFSTLGYSIGFAYMLISSLTMAYATARTIQLTRELAGLQSRARAAVEGSAAATR